MYGSPAPNHMLQEENHPPPNVEVGLHISTCLICFLCTSILSHNQRPRIWKTTRKNPERIREQLARIIVWSKVHMGSKGRKKKNCRARGQMGKGTKMEGRVWCWAGFGRPQQTEGTSLDDQSIGKCSLSSSLGKTIGRMKTHIM